MNSTLFDKLIAPLLLVVLTPAAAALGSKLLTGTWTLWFREHPGWSFIGGVCLIFMAILISMRRKPTSLAGYSVLIGGGGGSGRPIGQVEHAGVIWVVESPGMWHNHELPNLLDVALPPRCPDCRTELEERLRWPGAHLWTCIRCGFKKSNKDSYYTEQERTRRIAKVMVEEQLAQQPD